VGAVVRDRPWLVADRADVALAAGASGVHLPADGLAPAVVRRIWPRALISRAIHGPEEWTPDEPDWWLFGHLFPTRSKPGLPARGLDAARQATAGSERPVLGIGGITAENAERVSRAGLAGVAVVDAVWQAPDSVGAARGIRAAFERGREAR
jgi:thiazole tautomerase (transcriptional regulator TenI)